MEMDLNNIQWNEFIFGKIFNIFSTNSGIDKNKLNLKKGEIPYITRTDKNNAIDFFIGNQIEKYKIDKGNVITIGLDTQTVFYQSYKFYTGQNIQILSNDNINYFNSQFLIPLIKKQMEKFNWGWNGATLTRLKQSKIVLPAINQDKPNFAFMEQYMRQKEQEKLEKFKKYIAKKIEEIKDYQEVELPNQKKWGEFFIEDLFFVKIGKSIDGNKINKKSGKIAYITRKENNNGLDGFINNEKSFLNNDFPVITIGNETAEPFVQTYPFFTGTKVNILNPKNKISRYSLFFISSCLKKHKTKYSYSFTINSTRLKRQKILLPVDIKGQPDYEYMENYTKKIEYERLTKYINFKEIWYSV